MAQPFEPARLELVDATTIRDGRSSTATDRSGFGHRRARVRGQSTGLIALGESCRNSDDLVAPETITSMSLSRPTRAASDIRWWIRDPRRRMSGSRPQDRGFEQDHVRASGRCRCRMVAGRDDSSSGRIARRRSAWNSIGRQRVSGPVRQILSLQDVGASSQRTNAIPFLVA
jgi:hypothetical protein